MSQERNSENLFEGQLESQSDSKISEPRLYRVILHNDHYTTMEFVIQVLETLFHKSPAEATQIMLSVHKKGAGLCGLYTREIAETKIVAVHDMAAASQFPLKCTMEKE